jgi:predicted Fe-Mo cluster-binding NifX family protein
MEKVIVAIPSAMPGGLDSALGAHFGHCEIYTLVEIDGSQQVVTVSTLPNVPHEHGGCMAPVQFLAQHGVKALLAGGMGVRPLMGFRQMGIDVYHCGDVQNVGHAVQAFIAGKLPRFSTEFTCGGGA